MAKPVIEDLETQVTALLQRFPALGRIGQEYAARLELPSGAEGLFAIPPWQRLGRTYGEATNRIFDLLAGQRAFCNHRPGVISAQYLRETPHKVSAFARLGLRQRDLNIWVIAAQMGLNNRHQSIDRVRKHMAKHEFGLGAYETAIILYTNPNILDFDNDNGIDCPGDEVSPDGHQNFSHAPCFYGVDKNIIHAFRSIHAPDVGSGSITGYIPLNEM